MQKVFEVCILLSDLQPLCPGDLGKALVAFQVAKVLSVWRFGWRLCSGDYENHSPEDSTVGPTAMPGPIRGEPGPSTPWQEDSNVYNN